MIWMYLIAYFVASTLASRVAYRRNKVTSHHPVERQFQADDRAMWSYCYFFMWPILIPLYVFIVLFSFAVKYRNV